MSRIRTVRQASQASPLCSFICNLLIYSQTGEKGSKREETLRRKKKREIRTGVFLHHASVHAFCILFGVFASFSVGAQVQGLSNAPGFSFLLSAELRCASGSCCLASGSLIPARSLTLASAEVLLSDRSSDCTSSGPTSSCFLSITNSVYQSGFPLSDMLLLDGGCDDTAVCGTAPCAVSSIPHSPWRRSQARYCDSWPHPPKELSMAAFVSCSTVPPSRGVHSAASPLITRPLLIRPILL